VAQDYVENYVTNGASFVVSVETALVPSGTNTIEAAATGNNCNYCVFSGVLLDAFYIGRNTQPYVYNPDTSNTRTFTIYSYY
jgi:hypothetical protein